jgi:hypothetical protein
MAEELSAAGDEPKPKSRKGRERYNAAARGILADKYSEDDEDANDDGIADYLERVGASNKRISEALNKNPKFAQAFSDVLSGKRTGANAIARYFGKPLLELDEDSDDYKDFMKGEEERIAEAEEIAKDKEQYDANLAKSMELLNSFAESKGYQADDFKQQIYDKILVPVLSGNYTEETLQILLNGLNYDEDVNSAKDAGRIEARNERIEQMRSSKIGDGVGKGIVGSKSVNKEPKPDNKRPKNRIFELAKNA